MFWNRNKKKEAKIELIKDFNSEKEVNMTEEEFEEEFQDEEIEEEPKPQKRKIAPKVLPKLPQTEKKVEDRYVGFTQQEVVGVYDKETKTVFSPLQWQVEVMNKLDRILRSVEE